MRILFTVFLASATFCSFAGNGVKKSPLPNWVKPISPDNPVIREGNGGYQYLLIDLQENLITQSTFRHYVIKVLSTEGIRSVSDIDISFDPTYQTLSFHELKIIRDTKTIDKLQVASIQTLQRETSMERQLYDGSISAVINLDDVREGDIIEYSFSLQGFNPAHKGHYHQLFYHQFTTPVNRVYDRVVTHPEQKITVKTFANAEEPTVSQHGQQTEYVWDQNALDFKLYDTNVPSWFDDQKRVALTTFGTWSDVVDWAIPLYRYDEAAVENIDLPSEALLPGELRISRLIKMVQDDIRYLGFESGASAYQPHSPVKVFHQRYGDCKDKSLLLVALLRREGIPAYPLLVNTTLKGKIADLPPSHEAFDHCVVQLIVDGKAFYVDPTISNQGGNLESLSFPDYQKGLLIREGTTSLVDLPEARKTSLHIKELITVDSIGGSAEFTVRSEYTGSKADGIRSWFSSTSRESIQKEYLNYYSNLYPGIKARDEVKFYDYERHAGNKVIVEEYYYIDSFWKKDESDNLFSEVYPLVLEGLISYDKSPGRTMPYDLGYPHVFSQITEVDLPEDWNVTAEETTIEGDAFTYHKSLKGNGRTVSVSHRYELSASHVTADQVESLLQKHHDIQQQLSTYLTYNQATDGISLLSVNLAVIGTCGGIFFALVLYRKYDPDPWVYAEDKPIGGWLILPAIGLSISPFVLFFDVVGQPYFEAGIWDNVKLLGNGRPFATSVFIGAEIIYNFLYLVFMILVLVMFFQRRTAVPLLVSILYTIAIVGPALDLLLVKLLINSQMNENDYTASIGEILRSIVVAAIWIPYFNISERVKSTFCKTRNIRPQENSPKAEDW